MTPGQPAVVIDIGSGGIKAGHAGEKAPSFVFESVGEKTIQTEEWTTHYPISRGVIGNWDATTSMLLYSLKQLDAEQRPVLLTKPPLALQDQIDKLGEMTFETLKAPSLFVADEAVLSLYAAGLMNGIVCGSGQGLTYAVPVHSGFAVPDAAIRLNLGGKDLDSYLLQCLQKKGCSLEKFDNHDAIAKEIKEKFGKVAIDYSKVTQETSGSNYELPDGQIINIGMEAYQCPEALFKPSMMGMSLAGIHEIGNKAVQKCDSKIHKDLYNNIVLSGGSTMFPGFQKRFEKEILALAPPNSSIDVTASPQRNIAAWIGGSILAALDKFQPMWVLKSDYDENGSSIFRKKLQ